MNLSQYCRYTQAALWIVTVPGPDFAISDCKIGEEKGYEPTWWFPIKLDALFVFYE
jgi:hypothetical protein